MRCFRSITWASLLFSSLSPWLYQTLQPGLLVSAHEACAWYHVLTQPQYLPALPLLCFKQVFMTSQGVTVRSCLIGSRV